MGYKLLSEPIRKYIRKEKWESLRPIQAAAIDRIMQTDNHYILASRTASGKTEAAFLPILSKVDFNEDGVQVLYISPLIALINDQFYRIERMCRYLEINVTKWHGEAKRSLKNKLIKNPNGVVLITPESLEAMLVNHPYNVRTLFDNLKYIVIDEVHSFIGTDRGIQMMSILSRIQQLNAQKIITIGLSATIGKHNYFEAKKITGDTDHTKILLDESQKITSAKFKYFEVTSAELPLILLKDLYLETFDSKALIFPNTRGRAEEIAVKLRKISNRVNGHDYYFSHHSSVDKEIRENIEKFAKERKSNRVNFCISCTSTLELGIDIGSIDKVVQIDSTHSVSSLVQRIGRSGRREGQKSIVTLYTTNKWSFLQAFACWELYKEDFLEPLKIAEKPYDLLFHQMLSIVKQLSSCTKEHLVKLIRANRAFKTINELDINNIIEHSLKKDYLELIDGEIIIGIEGEYIVNSREFYSVFQSQSTFKVINAGRKIGEIPISPQIKIDENILLAAKIWKIIDLDLKAKRIEVIPAKDGKKPKFFGSGGNIHPRIRQKMLEIVKMNKKYEELDDNCRLVLEELKFEFKNYLIHNFTNQRPVILKGSKIILFTFTGTVINKSLLFLIDIIKVAVTLQEYQSLIEIELEIQQFEWLKQRINEEFKRLDTHIDNKLLENESLVGFCKWGNYLPLQYKREILKERNYDFEGALSFINNLELIIVD